MFLRWQQRKRKSRAFGTGCGSDTHWRAILAENLRVDGKPTQQHVAYLGGITDSALEHPAQRAFFWLKAIQQLDQLADRISKDERTRIEAALAAKVPRLTRQEYDAWIAKRAALQMNLGKPPSFKMIGG